MTSRVGPWKYDRGAGRWRRGGKFAAPPRTSQLRRDRAGNLIDDAGKRVPASAPVRASRKAAKSPAKAKGDFRYDRDSGRWRRGGRFAAPPKPSQLRTDKRGRLLDASGRAIPKSAPLAPGRKPLPPRKPPPKPPKPVKPSKRKEVKAVPPKVQQISRGTQLVEREYLSSSWKNRDIYTLSEVFKDVITKHAAKGPFQPQDVVTYQVGLKLVGEERLTPEMVSRMSAMVPPNATIKYVDTKVGTEVHVFLGGEPKLLGQSSRVFTENQAWLEDLYEELLDYWGDLDWYVFAETDEELYA